MSAYDRKQTSSKCGGFDLGAQRRLQLAMRGRCARRTRTWGRIAALYEALAALTHSPVIELNRAVAVGMAFGPEAGLELADRLTAEHLLEAAAVVMLAALVAITALTEGHGFSGLARPAGVLAGGVLAWRKAPFLVVVLAAAATTAVLRLLGVP